MSATTTRQGKKQKAARAAAYRAMVQAVRAWVNAEYPGVNDVDGHETDLIAVSFWNVSGCGQDVAQFHLDPDGHGPDGDGPHTDFSTAGMRRKSTCLFCEGNRQAEGGAR